MLDSTDNLLKQIALGEDSTLELKRVEFKGEHDEQAVPQAPLDALKAPLWQRFRSVLSPKDDREFLSKLKLITRDEDGNWNPTVSGVLMATERPADFITNAYIQAVLYRGTERNAAHQLDAKDIHGPLDEQIRAACTCSLIGWNCFRRGLSPTP